ncbi:MAG TPA: ATP-binding protein, partial [Thermoanaerobaculia bacterium]|nr:ATP-binding protein [Thermoanaerobaculia bacterium]
TLERIGTRVPPEDVPMLMDMIARAGRGELDFEYQHRIVFPDGRTKHLHLIAHRAGDREEVEYLGAVLDITQRRLSEDTLEKVRSELAHVTRIMSLGALTASIAHEVNQPLSGIVTNAGTCLRMLSAEPPNIEIAKETARRTIRDGNRAADIIARLRSLFSSKAAAHRGVDLNEAAREVLALLAGDLQRSRAILATDFAAVLPQVAGDRIQLQQVIMNLVRNASDAMRDVDDRPRKLLVRTRPGRDRTVELTVEDEGTGLETDDPEQLFRAFHTTKADGMGIGLSVSRSIVESHGGRLWAEANDGPGASFSFAVPQYGYGDPADGEAPAPSPVEGS